MLLMWICPSCKRDFARKNQTHTCISIKPDFHLRKMPKKVRDLYFTFIKKVGDVVPVRYDAISFAINMKARRHMGMIFIKSNHIKVEFKLPRKIIHPNISKIASLGQVYTHVVIISDLTEINSQLLDWLKESFEYNN